MTTHAPFSIRSFVARLAAALAIVILFALFARAGGPKCVAGTTYFNSSLSGQPLVWPLGQITYFSDQGDLSPVLPNTSANALIADAFSQWTSVPTAAIAANSGGQLAEDVNGSNVIVNSDGTISLPADIQSTAIGTPVGIVYDYDGSVTDALMGSGAGDSSQCFSNAVFGGDDNYGQLATYQHALIVINGQCAQQSSQLTDIEYRLVRVIGNVLGVGWSQLNTNVITGNPRPTSDDFAGFPVMHYQDPLNCIPITLCYPNPYQLAPDDMAEISRLYPVTAGNQSNFTNKQIFSTATASIHGSVWFTGASNTSTQAMQGVNVVARWIDPSTGLPSGRYAASSVTGFLFTGNAGNPITGFNDPLGDPYSDWGASSATFEGSFDLAGLPLPNGSSTQYQLTVEPLNTTWSVGVAPYDPYQVMPSGLPQPINVVVTAGEDVEQDVLMSASAQPVEQWSPTETWAAPAAIPTSGDWMGSLNGYGEAAYFLLSAQPNRTLSVAVTAFDESGNPTETKAQPVIGMWSASDPEGTPPPAFTSPPFNQLPFGVTRLDAQINSTSNFLVGISDYRGDGRPDYRYHAHVLYGDSVSPARIPVNGGAFVVKGMGFAPGLSVAIGNAAATPLTANAGQMLIAAPAQIDGPQSVVITDPVSGGFSTMTNVLTIGAAPDDNILLLVGLNPPTSVGTQAARPVSVKVVAADNVTPVAGATIVWTATNGVQLSACGGLASCSVSSDLSGMASTWLTPTEIAVSTITAALAPASYTSAKSVTGTLDAIETASDIGISTPYVWIAQGATLGIPLTARVLSNGVAQSGVTVNFKTVQGTATMSSSNAVTNSTGYATVTLNVTQLSSLVEVSACVAPSNAPCQIFYGNVVPQSLQQLQSVAGAGQVSTGQAFQPVVVRVTDSSSPPNPVMGATVTFQTTVMRTAVTSQGGGGETDSTDSASPVILAVSQTSALTDADGLANVVPSSAGFSLPLEVDVVTTTGVNAVMNDVLLAVPAPAPGSGSKSVGTTALPVAEVPVSIRRAIGGER
jgi:IPT/TIG domain